jgi:Ca2+-binding RTX toxin-like protein
MDRAGSGILGSRTRFLWGLVAISAVATLVAVLGEPVFAKRMIGTNGADRIVGTAKADRIKALGGNDRVNGRQGRDLIRGSRGQDRIRGAQGRDRLSAGKGADHLNAVDGRKDRAVSGGPGEDVCKIDQADLSLLRKCEEAKVENGGQGGQAGPGGQGGQSGDSLGVTSASGLVCGSSLPTCQFQIDGDGAEAPTGSVSGGGGVSTVAGAGVSVDGDAWTAAGFYGCTADGYLVVTIGSESVQVPITCTA